ALERVRRASEAPGGGVEDARVRRIERQVDRAGVATHVEDAVPRLAAVARAEHAALLVWPERVAHRRDVDEIGIVRMDADARDVARVFEADVLPRLAGVRRLPHAIAVRDVSADRLLAGTDVDDR